MPPPDKIYLQWHGDADPADYPNGPEPDSGDVTWCEDKIYEHDIEYVLASELAACREALSRRDYDYDQCLKINAHLAQSANEKTVEIERLQDEVAILEDGMTAAHMIGYHSRDSDVKALRAELAGMVAQRMAYAREFPPDSEGEPDTGSIHSNIRALKADLAECKQDAERLRSALRDLRAFWPPACGADRLIAEALGDETISRTSSIWSEAARKGAMPDCRNCVEFDDSAHRCAIRSPIVCIGGDAYQHADPVRLYETERGV